MKNRHILFAPAWYHLDLHRGVNAYAREQGWHVSSGMTHYTARFPYSWTGDGIISNFWSSPHKEFLDRQTAPMVGMGRALEGHVTVQPDYAAGAKMVADYFIKRGFEHFAWYIPVSYSDGALPLRFCQFRDYLLEQGYNCHFLKVPQLVSSMEERKEFLLKQLEQIPKPLAVLGCEDESASEILATCLEAGIYVPEEVAIVGTENDEMICEGSAIPLSSLDANYFKVGYTAAQKLHDLMDGKETSSHTLIPPSHIATRQSSDVMAVRDLEVAKALSFIKKNYLTAITVDDVVASSGISRCALFKAFKDNLERTPGEEILRRRLEESQYLLRETDYSIREVALHSGFGDYPRMYKAFVRKFGKTPKHYRLTKDRFRSE